MYHHYFDLKILKIKTLKPTLCIGLDTQACVKQTRTKNDNKIEINGVNILQKGF
jgi:hypothetical protein